jgi:hypothetical protein
MLIGAGIVSIIPSIKAMVGERGDYALACMVYLHDASVLPYKVSSVPV